MSSSLLATSWTVSLIAALTACSSGPQVQVADESTKLLEPERLPVESGAFDGKVLRLRAARGETLGVQVLLEDRSKRKVELALAAEHVRVNAFSVGYVRVREPSTAMYGPSRGAGRYPDILRPVAQPFLAKRQAYFDVQIDRRATPGTHHGTLSVGESRFSVELRVERHAIDIRHNPLVWVYYQPEEIARVHGVPDSDSPAELAIERRYYELFREHGAYLAGDLPVERFAARRQFTDGIAYWPVWVDRGNDEAIVRDVPIWLEQFRSLDPVPFVITLDEPKSERQKLRARHIARLIERAGGGRPKLLRAVTDAAAPVYGDAFDVYFSPHNIPRTARTRSSNGERFFTYNGRPPQAGSMIIDTDGIALRTWGWIAYRYGVDLWYAWEGLYFSDRYNDRVPTDVVNDPITFDERGRGGGDFGNGDGLLAYPGPLPSLRLKALRRGLQDRLLLLALERCAGGAEAAALARRVIPQALGEANGERTWSDQPMAWERARHAILDALDRRCDS